MNPYETLNVPNDADDAAIKKAYRREAQRVHPDREGGSEEAFHQVALAKDILTDPHRRDRYDRTGDVDDKPNPQTVAESKLAELFDSVINADEFDGNIIDTCKSKVTTVVQQLDQNIAKEESRKLKLERQLGRIKTDEFNLYEQILINKIEEIDRRVEHMVSERELIGRVSEMLNGYDDADPQPVKAQWGQQSFTVTGGV